MLSTLSNMNQEYLISLGHDREADTGVDDYLYSPGVDNLGISINTDGQCPLHVAATYSHASVAEILCTNFPYTVNRSDRDGCTPLHLASSAHVMPEMANLASPKTNRPAEDTKLIETLIGHGANVNAKDKQGNTCLHNATAWGNLKVVRTLIQSGADALCQNRAGWTPEYYSITVQAEVYYRNLVAEWEKRRAEEGIRQQSERRGRGGGAVRLVSDEESEELESEASRSRADTGESARSYTTASESEGGLGISVGSVDAWR